MKKKIEDILEDEILSPLDGTRNVIKTKKGKSFFLKIDDTQRDSLACEAEGLDEIRKYFKFHHLHTPILYHRDNNFLLMEYIPSHEKNDAFFKSLGIGLAKMHRIEKEKFGFQRDNYIGLNPQKNGYSSSWSRFFWEKRLFVQMGFLRDSSIERKLTSLKGIILDVLDNHPCKPSLLHGDLWGGNICCGLNNGSFLIDPAVYYGDRETDLAMTELFGGFTLAFYNAYMKEAPLSLGYEKRKIIYNLYHLLNHLNLFGESYLSEVHNSMEKIKKIR